MSKFIVVIFLLAGLLSCNNSDENNSNQEKPESTKTLSTKNILESKTDDKTISAVLDFGRDEIKKLNPVELSLNLLDKEGKKIQKASVVMDLTMPEMAMPKNEVKFADNENGIYKGTAIFTMRGKWRLNTIILINNTKKELFFDLVVN